MTFMKFLSDPLFQDLVNLTDKMFTEKDAHITITIRKDEIVERGYLNRESFEEEYLSKVFKEVSQRRNLDVELIKDLVVDRLQYTEQPCRTCNIQRGNHC